MQLAWQHANNIQHQQPLDGPPVDAKAGQHRKASSHLGSWAATQPPAHNTCRETGGTTSCVRPAEQLRQYVATGIMQQHAASAAFSCKQLANTGKSSGRATLLYTLAAKPLQLLAHTCLHACHRKPVASSDPHLMRRCPTAQDRDWAHRTA
jgi:hypothetical protein